MELIEIKAMLNQILWRIDGNPLMDIEGLAPRQKRVEDRLAGVEKHINHLIVKREVKRSAIKWIASIVGVLSFIFTVFEMLKSIL